MCRYQVADVQNWRLPYCAARRQNSASICQGASFHTDGCLNLQIADRQRVRDSRPVDVSLPSCPARERRFTKLRDPTICRVPCRVPRAISKCLFGKVERLCITAVRRGPCPPLPRQHPARRSRPLGMMFSATIVLQFTSTVQSPVSFWSPVPLQRSLLRPGAQS